MTGKRGRGQPRIGRAVKLTLPDDVIDAAERIAEQDTTPQKRVTKSGILRRWTIDGAHNETGQRP